MLSKLIIKNIKKNLGITLLSIITLFIVIFSFTIIDFIYTNIQKIGIEGSGGNNKEKFIITKKYEGFLKKFTNKSQLSQIYNELKKDKNINNMYALYSTKIPGSANVNFMGFDFNTDILIYATDKYSNTGDNLKLGISSTVLNLYNSQFGNETMFPNLDKGMLEKIDITLIFGKNSFFSFKNSFSMEGNIKYIDNDFPLLGFVVSKKNIDLIIKRLGIPKAKIYKIIAFSKDSIHIINKLKTKYPHLSIQGYNDIEQKVNNKLKSVKYTFFIIKGIISIVLIAFIIVLSILIWHKNINNIKVLFYNGANHIKQFSIIFGEISFYSFISIVISIVSVFILNKQIPKINNFIEKKGIVNIHINNIKYTKLIKNGFELYIIIVFISYMIFMNRKNII